MIRPASEKQLYWIEKLVDEKDIAEDLRETIKLELSAGVISSRGASVYLDTLFAARRRPEPVLVEVAANPVTEEGFYQLGDNVYRVVTSRTSGRLYAKLATARGWDYEGGKGMMRRLTADMKMTGEQIAAFGVTHGFCLNCSTGLADPISVHIGLGTSCGPKILGSEDYKARRKAAKLVPAVAAALAEIKAAKLAEKEAEAAREAQLELV